MNIKQNEVDPIYKEAVTAVKTRKRVGTSFIQRTLRIGYNRAARLMEQMENEGIVSSMKNHGARNVISNEEISVNQRLARKYRKNAHVDGIKGGLVVIYNNKAVSWMIELHDSKQQAPGCIAINESGEEWLAVGGNDIDGANCWEKIKHSGKKK